MSRAWDVQNFQPEPNWGVKMTYMFDSWDGFSFDRCINQRGSVGDAMQGLSSTQESSNPPGTLAHSLVSRDDEACAVQDVCMMERWTAPQTCDSSSHQIPAARRLRREAHRQISDRNLQQVLSHYLPQNNTIPYTSYLITPTRADSSQMLLPLNHSFARTVNTYRNQLLLHIMPMPPTTKNLRPHTVITIQSVPDQGTPLIRPLKIAVGGGISTGGNTLLRVIPIDQTDP